MKEDLPMKKYYVVEWDEEIGVPTVIMRKTYLMAIRHPIELIAHFDRIGNKLICATIRKATFWEWLIRYQYRPTHRLTRR